MEKENNSFNIEWVVYTPSDINMTLKQHGISKNSQPTILPIPPRMEFKIYVKSKDCLFILVIPNPMMYRRETSISSLKKDIEQLIRDNKSVRQSFQILIVALPNNLKNIKSED